MSVVVERSVLGMDVKEAAGIAAGYTVDMETLGNPEDTSLFLVKSGFAIESTRYSDEDGCWEIGVGFVRDGDRAKNSILAQGDQVHDRRTYKTVTIRDSDGVVVRYR